MSGTSDSTERNEKGRGEPRRSNPRPADEQESPQPERPETLREAEGQAVRDQEDPPKAEGDRDEAESPAPRD